MFVRLCQKKKIYDMVLIWNPDPTAKGRAEVGGVIFCVCQFYLSICGVVTKEETIQSKC